MTTDILRPIIGVENRTAQEVFDIMCDRFRHRQAHSLPRDVGMLLDAVKNASGFLDTPWARRKLGNDPFYRDVVESIRAALTPSAPDENITAPAPGSFIDMVQDAQEQGKLVKAGAVQSESACNKCGAKYPTAPADHLHKCGLCSGICSPITPSALSGDAGEVEVLREALDAAHYYIDASPGELADRGITRDDALRIAREKRPSHQGAGE